MNRRRLWQKDVIQDVFGSQMHFLHIQSRRQPGTTRTSRKNRRPIRIQLKRDPPFPNSFSMEMPFHHPEPSSSILSPACCWGKDRSGTAVPPNRSRLLRQHVQGGRSPPWKIPCCLAFPFPSRETDCPRSGNPLGGPVPGRLCSGVHGNNGADRLRPPGQERPGHTPVRGASAAARSAGTHPQGLRKLPLPLSLCLVDGEGRLLRSVSGNPVPPAGPPPHHNGPGRNGAAGG